MALLASSGELLITITTKPCEAKRRMIPSYTPGSVPPPGPQTITPCFLSEDSSFGKQRIEPPSGPDIIFL